jgi:hypothetical protein
VKVFIGILFAAILFSIPDAFSQQRSLAKSDKRKTYPVIGHDKNSPFPDSVHVVGTIAEEPSRGVCGTYCEGGTIKVKLKQPVAGYTDEYIYLITACLSREVKKDIAIDVTAVKYRNDKPVYECYYYVINNKFDSRGTPFYMLSEPETKKISK